MKYPFIATAVLAACLGSGCTRKAEGQTVAVVNGEEITVPDLNFALEQAKVPDSASKDQVKAQILEQLVDRRLLAEQARKEGIDKTPDYLNRQRRADEDLLISMLADRRLKTTQIPSQSEVQSFISTHPEMFANREVWSLDQLAFAAPSNEQVKAQIQAAHSIDALVSVLQTNKIAYRRQKNKIDTSVVPPELFAKLNTLPANEPFALTAGSQMIASAISAREPHPLIGDDAKPVAAAAIRKQQTAKGLESLVKSLKSSAKIDYQSGYGPPKKS